MQMFTYILILLIAIITIAFATLNADFVKINYFFGSKMLPLIVLILIALIIGVLLSLLFVGLSLLRLKCINKKLQKQLKQAQEAIK